MLELNFLAFFLFETLFSITLNFLEFQFHRLLINIIISKKRSVSINFKFIFRRLIASKMYRFSKL